jgi:hypothetical protein
MLVSFLVLVAAFPRDVEDKPALYPFSSLNLCDIWESGRALLGDPEKAIERKWRLLESEASRNEASGIYVAAIAGKVQEFN